MRLTKFRLANWQRRLSLVLVGLVVALGLTGLPVTAQTETQSPFCVATEDPISDSVQGRSYGDPHINTFDQLHYSFQTIGEYILSQSADKNFEVQARQGRVGNQNNLSLNTAVALGVCGHRVGIYVQDAPDGRTPLWIDGIPTPLEETAIPLPGGGEVQQQGSDYAVIWPSGDQVLIHPISVSGDTFLNIMPTLSPDHAGDVTGLLGNFNGDPDDDLMSRDGSVIPAQSTYSIATNALDSILPSVIPVRQIEDAYFEDLYRQFGDSWRVTQVESLFDYASGQSTASFTDRNFPSQFFTLNAVAPAQIEAAVTTCQEAGVDEALMDGCVFDVAATGETSFADAAVNAVANVVVREIRDRIVDEVQDEIRDAIPLPRLPF